MTDIFRLIFMGTPSFALPTLKALIDSPHEAVAVYTQPPRPAGRGQQLRASPVQEFAEKNGIPVFTPTSLKSPEAHTQFAAHNADIAVVAAYGLLLPKAILAAPKHGCINIHPSLLPRWRGAAPIQRTLMAGDTDTGVCIMQMDEGLDTGDVLMREDFRIPATMNAGELHDALAEIGARLTLSAMSQLGRMTPQKQSAEGVTYAQKITKEDGRIDWSRSASEINNLIRALAPSPGAYFDYDGETIKVFAAKPVNTPGTPLTIACGNNSFLRLLELQRPGKKRMQAEEFLKGFPIAL